MRGFPCFLVIDEHDPTLLWKMFRRKSKIQTVEELEQEAIKHKGWLKDNYDIDAIVVWA
jgi:hypothetical protein